MVHSQRILMIGATGMLGRPVARRLVREQFDVVALVRDAKRAKLQLSGEVELRVGDLEDADSIIAAMDGVDAVYLNLAAPMRRDAPDGFEPERDGTRNAIESAKRAGVGRILRISAMGVDEAAENWWAARHKAEADGMVRESGLGWTIFRPTWFMESLATMVMGPLLLQPRIGRAPLRWIAGDDYGRQVAAALRSDDSINRTYHPQGPELVLMADAVERFAKAWPRTVVRAPLFEVTARLASLFSQQASYMSKLLEMTRRQFSSMDRKLIETDLPKPKMMIEDYVRYMMHSGDRPRK